MATGWLSTPKSRFGRGRGGYSTNWNFRGRGRGQSYGEKFSWSVSSSNSQSSIDLRRIAVPHYRKPGECNRKRVVVDEKHWEQALENLKKEVGGYRVVGFDVECVNENNEKQAQRVEKKMPPKRQGRSFARTHSRRRAETNDRGSNSDSEPSSDGENSAAGSCDYTDSISPKSVLEPVACLPRKNGTKRRQETAVLIQLATWSGYVVLLRLCFWKCIPQSLLDFLADPTYLKVGVSIDEDAARLREDWNMVVKGWIDLRNVFLDTAMVHNFELPSYRRRGLKYLAEGIFGAVAIPYDANRMRSLAWSNWNSPRLSLVQVGYASWDAQIAVDLFSFMTQRLCNVKFPKRYNEEYFNEVLEKCRRNIERRGSSDGVRNSDDEKADYRSSSPDGMSDIYPGLKGTLLPATGALPTSADLGLVSRPPLADDSAILQAGRVMKNPNEKVVISPVTQEGIAVLIIRNKPFNVMDITTLRLMKVQIQKLEDDGVCRALVITSDRSASTSFSVGFDLNVLTKCSNDEVLRSYVEAVLDLWLQIYKSPLVTVALINGIAVGGGTIVAACCDRRVISSDAGGVQFNEVEMGITLPPWVIMILVQLMGFHRAEYVLTTAPILKPEVALQYGFVDRLVPENEEPLEAAFKEMCALLKLRDCVSPPLKLTVRRAMIDKIERERELVLEALIEEIKSSKCQETLALFTSRRRR